MSTNERVPPGDSGLGWRWLSHFQHLQTLHDQKYEVNAYFPLVDRLSDQLFHLMKYNGKLASSAWNSTVSTVRETTVTDSLIVATSMANVLEIDLGLALRRQGMTVLENWHPVQDLSAWLREHHHASKNLKARHRVEFDEAEFIIYVTMPRLLATLARTLGSLKRAKSLDYRTLLNTAVIDYWCSCVVLYSHCTPAPFSSAVCQRLTALERQRGGHERVGVYSQRYEVPNLQEAHDEREFLLATLALATGEESQKEEKKN